MNVKNETPAGELSDEQIVQFWRSTQDAGFSVPGLPSVRFARAVIAAGRALRPVASVPTGWQLVPVVPTQEMLLSGAVLFGCECGRLEEKALSSEDWQAMLAAAPKPPAAATTGDELVRQADAQAALAAKDAEIARLESAWQVDTVRRKDGIIAQQEAENDRLRAELAAMTVERDTLAAPVLLTKNQIHLALDAAGVMPDGLTFERELRVARAIEAAVHAANPALGSEGGAA